MDSVHIKAFQGKEGFYKIKNDWDTVVNGISHRTFCNIYACTKGYIDTTDNKEAINL